MNPQAYCRQICRQSHSNFVKTFLFLSAPRRRAFEAFYAFCRLVDDAVDEAPHPDTARKNLTQWSEEVERLYQGSATHPVGQALQQVVTDYNIPRQYLDDLIAGCRMDLEKSRYESFAELKQYCYHVASCVGLVSLHLFGAELTDTTRQAAIDLGTAVQLTNIIRDVVCDRDQGRLYFPLEDLRQFNIKEEEFLSNNGRHPQMLAFLQFQIERARSYYRKAWDLFPQERHKRRSLMAAQLMGKIYESILNKIEKDPLRIFKEKVALSAWQKLLISGRFITKRHGPL